MLTVGPQFLTAASVFAKKVLRVNPTDAGNVGCELAQRATAPVARSRLPKRLPQTLQILYADARSHEPALRSRQEVDQNKNDDSYSELTATDDPR